jgi:hypothetical protein
MHNEELHNFYSSPHVIRMTKSRRMSLAGNVVRMGERRNACRVLVGKPSRLGGRIILNILNSILEKLGCYGLDSSGSV